MKILDKCRRLEKAALVLKNASVINVFSNEIIKQDIAIEDGKIIGVGTYQGECEINLEGKYVAPGFIDSHVHIESSMVSPIEFAKTIVPFGTTTIVADPHEIANVLGLAGVRYMIAEGERAAINIYYMLPSCVPVTSQETNGAVLDAKEIEQMIDNPNILGLGEMMNYQGVILGDEEVWNKIRVSQSKIIDGHAPKLDGYDLMAYAYSGISTDHECSEIDEVIDRIRIGMTVQIRKGSAVNNLTEIIGEMLKRKMSFERCVFCTDDKHLEHILGDGHINSNIRESISLGVPPLEAIKMATLYPARLYNLTSKGAIAPGFDADIVVLENLEELNIEQVMVNGIWRCGQNAQKEENKYNRYTLPSYILNSVKCQAVDKESLQIPLEDKKAVVIGIEEGQLLTNKLLEVVPIEGGCFVANSQYSKMVVCDRYGKGNIGKGIVKGFNIRGGAIAQTIAHDSHNILCVGDNDRDMAYAINILIKKQGGIVVVKDGEVLDYLHLPIAGLMSMLKAEEVITKLEILLQQAKKLEVNENIDPFLTLGFLSLPVIPEIKLTDKGVFDVALFKHISIQ